MNVNGFFGREKLHMAIKKRPKVGKVNQKKKIAGKMENCIWVYLSSFLSEVMEKFDQGREQTWGFDETSWLLHLLLRDLQVPQ